MKSHPVNGSAAHMRYMEFEGSGPPLLMIHGLGCASSFEYPHVARSGSLRNRHVILLDLLGFGFSDRPDDFGYEVRDHALQVAQFVTGRGFGSIDIYGHSMGGSIAIETADRLGDQVGNLVLSEANLDSGGGEFSRGIALTGQDAYVQHGHERVISDALRRGNANWAATMRSAAPRAVFLGARSLVEGTLPGWRSRFLCHPARKAFIFGQRNLPDPDAAALPASGIRVLVVENAGHSMGLENPSGLAGVIASALTFDG